MLLSWSLMRYEWQSLSSVCCWWFCGKKLWQEPRGRTDTTDPVAIKQHTVWSDLWLMLHNHRTVSPFGAWRLGTAAALTHTDHFHMPYLILVLSRDCLEKILWLSAEQVALLSTVSWNWRPGWLNRQSSSSGRAECSRRTNIKVVDQFSQHNETDT